ncbi:hypothetical protein TcWFU_007355 [Taenia crassiceps]|uniref:Secreted protein n=1 Tax=Taenia crassiceps TaxID=6207 RepID=A0ABR4QSE7_9CEST
MWRYALACLCLHCFVFLSYALLCPRAVVKRLLHLKHSAEIGWNHQSVEPFVCPPQPTNFETSRKGATFVRSIWNAMKILTACISVLSGAPRPAQLGNREQMWSCSMDATEPQRRKQKAEGSLGEYSDILVQHPTQPHVKAATFISAWYSWESHYLNGVRKSSEEECGWVIYSEVICMNYVAFLYAVDCDATRQSDEQTARRVNGVNVALYAMQSAEVRTCVQLCGDVRTVTPPAALPAEACQNQDKWSN